MEDKSSAVAESGSARVVGGKPYRPSNGTEGEIFHELWCANCRREAAFRSDPANADGCWIIAQSMAYRADEAEYPPEWIYSANGTPVCTAFEAERKTTAMESHNHSEGEG